MRWLLPLILAAACGPVDESETPVRWLDHAEFAEAVQPVLAARCGNPSCHGRTARPFAIYSQRNWRLDPARTHLDEPLTETELRHNYDTSCVFASEAASPAEALLVLKPLAETAGVAHGGGVIFDGTSDRDYLTLLRWIEGGWE